MTMASDQNGISVSDMWGLAIGGGEGLNYSRDKL